MSDDILTIRLAEADEKAELIGIHHRALRELSFGFMKRATVEAFIQSVNTLEDHLLDDRTYYVVTIGGQIAACGGWSLRTPGYQTLTKDDTTARHAAVPTIRAMFVNPDFARRGIGRRLLGHIESEIRDRRFLEAKLTATPMGRPLYERCGWSLANSSRLTFPGDQKLLVYNMSKTLAAGDVMHWPRSAA
jgi:GNAT superfamily N-acetyltransferase